MVTDSMVLSLPTFWTSASSHFIVDQDNRTRVFHGVNFVQKGFPWYPQALLDDDHIKSLRDMGLNTVRLGWMWTGAEPTQGHYNLTYFDIMGGIVDNLAKYGIYAFLDVHQDVLSSYYCSYDGAPTWAVDMSDPSKHATPWPLPSDVNNHNCSSKGGWAVNYASESCGTAFQTLFKDGPFRDSFAAFWKRTATYFKNKPILGYEIINEPWCGNQYADLELMLPGVAGHKNLMPFYDVITDSIRSVDDQVC